MLFPSGRRKLSTMLQKGRCSPSLRMLRRGEAIGHESEHMNRIHGDPEQEALGPLSTMEDYLFTFPQRQNLRSMVIFTGSQTLAKNIFNKFSNKMDLTYTA